MDTLGRQPSEAVLLAGRYNLSRRVEAFLYQDLVGACVYIYYTREQEVLYVGRSSRGLQRALQPYKGRITISEDSIDRVEILWCESSGAASALETLLIFELQPRLNVKGKKEAQVRKPTPRVRAIL